MKAPRSRVSGPPSALRLATLAAVLAAAGAVRTHGGLAKDFWDWQMQHQAGPLPPIQQLPQNKPQPLQPVTQPGYRTSVSKSSQEFYRYVMNKVANQGDESLTPGERWTIQMLISTRQWPERPEKLPGDEHAERYIQAHDTVMANMAEMAQVAGGKRDYDLPPTKEIEQFRNWYYSLRPEQRNTMANAMMLWYRSLGYDMRSDGQRKWEEDKLNEAAEREAAADEARRMAQEIADENERRAEEAKAAQEYFEAVRARERLEEAIRKSREEDAASTETPPVNPDDATPTPGQPDKPETPGMNPDQPAPGNENPEGDQPGADKPEKEPTAGMTGGETPSGGEAPGDGMQPPADGQPESPDGVGTKDGGKDDGSKADETPDDGQAGGEGKGDGTGTKGGSKGGHKSGTGAKVPGAPPGGAGEGQDDGEKPPGPGETPETPGDGMAGGEGGQPGNDVRNDAGDKVDPGRYQGGDMVVTADGTEYENKGGKWVPTGNNYGAYKPDGGGKDDGLKGGEPKAGDPDAGGDGEGGGAEGGTLAGFLGGRSDRNSEHAGGSFGLMSGQANVSQASTRGDQGVRDARNTLNAAGQDSQLTGQKSSGQTAAGDRENGWGKAIADGLQSGVENGIKGVGEAFGKAAADHASDRIFRGGGGKDDSTGAGSAAVGGANTAGGTAGTAAGGAQVAGTGTRSGGGHGDGTTKTTKGTRNTAGTHSGTGAPGGNSSHTHGAGGTDAAGGGAGSPGTTAGTAGTAGTGPGTYGGGTVIGGGTSGGHGYCPKCGRTDLVEHIIDRPEMTIHDWRCPVCNVTGRTGTPPPGLGSAAPVEKTRAPAARLCPYCGKPMTATTIPADPSNAAGYRWTCFDCGVKK